ncbi:flavodoxin family protein [Enemella sp. A6]|uniref:flavodoxin family protein n=1 Tax=Enemella sp. A6 TaxID=3440152 RepID=UPI003EB6B2EF
MAVLLVIHHSATDNIKKLVDAALAGAHDPAIEGVEVNSVSALAWATGEVDEVTIKRAKGYLFITPANFGYMSGALKHVFDSTFLKIGGALDEEGNPSNGGGGTRNRPYGVIVHGRYDTEGAVRSVESIAGALGWKPAGTAVESLGDVTAEQLAAARELGGTLAALLME